MKLIKTAAAVLNQTPMDWRGNAANLRAAITQARDQGVSVLCLPELCTTGYGCEDAFHMPDLRTRAWRMLVDALPLTRGMVVAVGVPVLHHNGLYNTVAVVVDGAVAGLVAKRHLAGEGLHYEPRWFKAWPDGVRSTVRIDDQDFPIGDLHFDIGGVKIGFEVCEDAWVAQRPGAGLAEQGVDLILNPSASHFAFGKLETRKRFVIEGSRAFGVTYVYSNFVGNEAGRAIYDGGALIATGGKLVAQGARFSFEAHAVVSAVVDVDATRTSQARTASFVPRVEPDPRCVAVPFRWPQLEPQASVPIAPEKWELSDTLKEEEFTRAITLALFDYMRKSRSNGFVISLSGGADSAAVACLVSMMVRLALAQLGPEKLAYRLAYLRAEHAVFSDAKSLIASLLTCAYQATRNSGNVTRDAARAVAAAAGATYHELNVDSLMSGYIGAVEGAIGRKLTWERDDLALQNIQARTRGPSVWMLANLRNALLLATSNRSEAAVGYATMDGDTCGGLSPVAGIDKAFIRQYLRWLEKTGPVGLGPIDALRAVNVQAPTAELRPPSSHQTDEDDLMPYDVLDAIESAAIGDKHAPLDIYHLLRAEFSGYPPATLVTWIERFFRLWCRNQWKRERYAPALHVDDKNLDPRSWCRFPILSGGFEDELAALRNAVK